MRGWGTWNVEDGMRVGDLKCGICKEEFGNWNMECDIFGFKMWNTE